MRFRHASGDPPVRAFRFGVPARGMEKCDRDSAEPGCLPPGNLFLPGAFGFRVSRH